MNLRLLSDFREDYDIWFDREGQIFTRFAEDFLTKRNQLTLLDAAGFNTPKHNYLYKLYNYVNWSEDDSIKNFVVYINHLAHRGEGKIVLTREDVSKESLKEFSKDSILNCYASQYISTEDKPSNKTHRILNIGNRQFRINYSSDDPWRSNCGNVKVEFDTEIFGDMMIPSPLEGRALWAVDFAGGIFAIDLNTSPGLRGTGIEDVLKPKEVVDLIKEFYGK